MNTNLEVTDIAKAQIIAAQQEWIDNVTTQMFVTAIRNRKAEYDRRLTDRCRRLTDVNSDIQDRACISTCDAILKIMADVDLFVHYSTLKIQ